MVTAWILRDFAKPLIARIPWIMRSFGEHGQPPDEWFGAQAVYRLCMGSFLLYTVLALTMWGVRSRADWRDRYLHHGNWLLKVATWTAFSALPFFLSEPVVSLFARLARWVSPIFLLLQLLALVDGTQSWNDTWVEAGEHDERFLYALLGATVLAYAGACAALAVAWHWFVPSFVEGVTDLDCSFNAGIILAAALLVLVVTIACLHPRATQGSLFPSAAVSLYVAQLAYAALAAEPRDYECNLLGRRLGAGGGLTLAGGALVALLTVVYSAFRAGSADLTWGEEASSSRESGMALLGDEAGAGEGAALGAPRPLRAMSRAEAAEPGSYGAASAAPHAPIPYSYAQFYAVLALASAYVSMLMTGWGAGMMAPGLVDVGWTSVYVKCATQWGAGALYLWMLFAPAFFPDRDFY